MAKLSISIQTNTMARFRSEQFVPANRDSSVLGPDVIVEARRLDVRRSGKVILISPRSASGESEGRRQRSDRAKAEVDPPSLKLRRDKGVESERRNRAKS